MDKSILVVEDESALREMIATVLEDETFIPFQAEHGRQAIEILHQRPIDLVVSDITMPVMDGLELGIYCRQKFPHIPFVLMSGGSRELQNHDGDKYLQTAMELTGACCVLYKPFSLGEFIQVIRENSGDKNETG